MLPLLWNRSTNVSNCSKLGSDLHCSFSSRKVQSLFWPVGTASGPQVSNLQLNARINLHNLFLATNHNTVHLRLAVSSPPTASCSPLPFQPAVTQFTYTMKTDRKMAKVLLHTCLKHAIYITDDETKHFDAGIVIDTWQMLAT